MKHAHVTFTIILSLLLMTTRAVLNTPPPKKAMTSVMYKVKCHKLPPTSVSLQSKIKHVDCRGKAQLLL